MSRPTSTTDSATPGRYRQKQLTRKLLLEAARALLEAGQRPSVTEAADAASISRRTAYRYFPTQEKLPPESALEGLRPVMDRALALTPTESDQRSIEARVDALVRNMMLLAFENETLLRTMIHQTVVEKAQTDTPRRGTRRVEWIEAAINPLKSRLSRAKYARLVSALAVCTGMEAILVLRDIRGLTAEQTIQISRWMAQAHAARSIGQRSLVGGLLHSIESKGIGRAISKVAPIGSYQEGVLHAGLSFELHSAFGIYALGIWRTCVVQSR